MRLILPLLASCALAFVARTESFSIRTRLNHQPLGQTRAFMTSGGAPENPLEGGELLSTLASLEREWTLQQQAEGSESRWTKLILPSDSYQQVTEQAAAYESLQDFVYLLEPPNGKPDYVISFLGGAGLGQFPQVAYNEFLVRVSDKLNAAVITSPYQTGLDHYYLSKLNGERLRKAYAYCQKRGKFPKSLPVYCLAHSLGCKLQTIYVAATKQKYDGMGFLAFNNFSFSQTMSMAKDFAGMLKGKPSGRPASPYSRAPPPSGGGDLMSSILGIAELAVGAMGIDFTPSQAEMDRLIQQRYDDNEQKKTRLFVFDSDTLDSSREFVLDCHSGVGPSVSGLKGNHLTPVFFKESRGGATSGASFGKEQDLDALVDEVCGWIQGKAPTRGPNW